MLPARIPFPPGLLSVPQAPSGVIGASLFPLSGLVRDER